MIPRQGEIWETTGDARLLWRQHCPWARKGLLQEAGVTSQCLSLGVNVDFIMEWILKLWLLIFLLHWRKIPLLYILLDCFIANLSLSLNSLLRMKSSGCQKPWFGGVLGYVCVFPFILRASTSVPTHVLMVEEEMAISEATARECQRLPHGYPAQSLLFGRIFLSNVKFRK